MKKVMLGILIIVIEAIQCGAKTAPPLKFSLACPELEGREFVECEPLPATLTWVNISKKPLPLGAFRLDPVGSGLATMWVNGAPSYAISFETKYSVTESKDWDLISPWQLKPGESKSDVIDLRSFHYPNPGSYNIFAVADFGKYPVNGFQGTIRTNACHYTIRPALGVDREALDWYYNILIKRPMTGNPPPDIMKQVTCRSIVEAKDLLDHYPTSTYAGWALLKQYPGIDLSGYSSIAKMVQYALLPEEKKMEESAKSYGRTLESARKSWISPQKQANQFIHNALLFLQTHPDHFLNGMIGMNLGAAYLVIHKPKAAHVAFKKSLAFPIPESFNPYHRLPDRKAILNYLEKNVLGWTHPNSKRLP